MTPKRVHFKLDPRIGKLTACGMPYHVVTYDPAKTTCRRCKQSVLWQREARADGIDARPGRKA